MVIYLIGSLRNPEVPKIANRFRDAGFDVFDDWYSAGETADDSWRDYEKAKGHTYEQALQGYAAKHVFEFDRFHIQRADAVLLALPAGKSGHLELGWALGQGKPGFILLDSPERWDVMYQFADMVTSDEEKIIEALRTLNADQSETQMALPFMSSVGAGDNASPMPQVQDNSWRGIDRELEDALEGRNGYY
jgi:nucleoside 2-deoxyribosyltransferase